MSGAAAAAAAAAARRKMLEEEEQMTGYNQEDLHGWEFKIVRANTRKFRDPAVVRRICEEEAQAGWELLEKFDDYRLRFKRRTDKRGNDQYLTTDPYRTTIGITEGQLVVTILGVTAAVALLIFLGVMFFRQ